MQGGSGVEIRTSAYARQENKCEGESPSLETVGGYEGGDLCPRV